MTRVTRNMTDGERNHDVIKATEGKRVTYRPLITL